MAAIEADIICVHLRTSAVRLGFSVPFAFIRVHSRLNRSLCLC
jgi:hypothetical protein